MMAVSCRVPGDGPSRVQSLGLHLCSIYVSGTALILLMALEDVFLAKDTLGRATLNVVRCLQRVSEHRRGRNIQCGVVNTALHGFLSIQAKGEGAGEHQ